MYWKKTIKKMTELTKPGGLVWFVVCSNWEEHGTRRTSPEQSLTTQISDEWADYYKNLTVADIRKGMDFTKFSHYVLEENPHTNIDTCFWGIKK
jgi:hypothetical protein